MYVEKLFCKTAFYKNVYVENDILNYYQNCYITVEVVEICNPNLKISIFLNFSIKTIYH